MAVRGGLRSLLQTRQRPLLCHPGRDFQQPFRHRGLISQNLREIHEFGQNLEFDLYEFQLYRSMVGEDGWCVNFDKSTRKCSIYDGEAFFFGYI